MGRKKLGDGEKERNRGKKRREEKKESEKKNGICYELNPCQDLKSKRWGEEEEGKKRKKKALHRIEPESHR